MSKAQSPSTQELFRIEPSPEDGSPAICLDWDAERQQLYVSLVSVDGHLEQSFPVLHLEEAFKSMAGFLGTTPVTHVRFVAGEQAK